MYIHDFFQNFLKTFLVCFHGAFTSSVIAPDIPPRGIHRSRGTQRCRAGGGWRLHAGARPWRAGGGRRLYDGARPRRAGEEEGVAGGALEPACGMAGEAVLGREAPMREGQRGYCQAALSCAAEIRRARGPPSKRTKSRCRRQDPPSSSPESSSATGKIRRTPDRRARAPPPRSAELHSGGKQGGGGRVGSAPGRRGCRWRRSRGGGAAGLG